MSSQNKRTTLKQVLSSPLSRGFSLAAMGMRASMRLGSYSLTSFLLSGEQLQAKRHQMLSAQAQLLADELGKLKGSMMKVGQMLALYGEQLLLPPEVVEVLRTLQDDSPPLDWSALEPVLTTELGAARLAELEVDPEPLAAASLGQVHRARRLRDGRGLCIKIQYPGVAESIDSDLNTVGTLLLFSRLLPKGFDLNDMLAEVRGMLYREVDYRIELDSIQRFRQLLAPDSRFRVPEVFPEYSTPCVLTTTYEPGFMIGGPEARGLSQARRNRIGYAALDLFLREFFEWNLMQTDPHFGNYRIQADPQGEEDRLVLLDFGAVREFPDAFRYAYYELVRGAFWKDRERLVRAAIELNFMPATASRDALDHFAEMCFLIVEPFDLSTVDAPRSCFTNANGEYRWGDSDLPQRVALAASRASLSLSFRLPPREFIFLHRKLGGVFVLLAELKAELNARPLLLRFMGQAVEDSAVVAEVPTPDAAQ